MSIALITSLISLHTLIVQTSCLDHNQILSLQTCLRILSITCLVIDYFIAFSSNVNHAHTIYLFNSSIMGCITSTKKTTLQRNGLQITNCKTSTKPRHIYFCTQSFANRSCANMTCTNVILH